MRIKVLEIWTNEFQAQPEYNIPGKDGNPDTKIDATEAGTARVVRGEVMGSGLVLDFRLPASYDDIAAKVAVNSVLNVEFSSNTTKMLATLDNPFKVKNVTRHVPAGK